MKLFINLEKKRDNKIIKLIYDKYENDITTPISLIYDKYECDIGVSNDDDDHIIIDTPSILNKLPTKINDIDINIHRTLTIYSWGIKKDHDHMDCDLIFDLTQFQTIISKDIDVKTITGLSDTIQNSIIHHPLFLEIIEHVVTYIETENSTHIAFVCNHGKHRSVAWAELLKTLYYNKSSIKHLQMLQN